MNEHKLSPGFDDPVHGAQSIFRALLEAMSRPGRKVILDDLPEAPSSLPSSLAAIALTLFDADTKVYLAGQLDNIDIRNYISFHCGAPYAASIEEADFVLAANADDLPAFSELRKGEVDFPDRSATVFVAIENLSGGEPVELSGPGIKGTMSFGASDLTSHFWQQMQANQLRYPLGVDVVLCEEHHLAAIPRSTQIQFAKKG